MNVALLIASLVVGEAEFAGSIQMALPPQWAEVGVPWRLYWDTVGQYNGAWPYTETWALDPVPATGPVEAADGLSWTPGAAASGTYTLHVRVWNGGDEVAYKTAALTVSPAGALAGSVSVLGDSISAPNSWQADLADDEPSISWLGTVALANGLLTDSRGGWQFAYYASATTYSGVSIAGCLVCGPRAYVNQAGEPSVIVWSCGHNDASGAATAAATQAAYDYLDAMIALWRRDYPEVRHVIWTPTYGSSSAAMWAAYFPVGQCSHDQWCWEQRWSEAVRHVLARFGWRQGEGIYLAATATGVDPGAAAYGPGDPVHPTATGYQQIADSLRAVLAAAMR